MAEPCEAFEKVQGEYAASIQREIDSMENDLAMARQIAANLTHRIAMMRRVHDTVVDYKEDAVSEKPAKRERRKNRPKGGLQNGICNLLKDWMTSQELSVALEADHVHIHRLLKDLLANGKIERRKRIRAGERARFEHRLIQEGGLFEHASEDSVSVSGDQRDGGADRDPEGVSPAGDAVPSGS